MTKPWLIHFFRTEDGRVPTRTFLEAVPIKVAAEIHAVIEAVAAAPPPTFSGGGKWEAMHGVMRGLYEVRTRQGRTLYRLLCLLEQASDDLDGPSIVCLDGLSKRDGSAAAPKDYAWIRRFADEFRRCHAVDDGEVRAD